MKHLLLLAFIIGLPSLTFSQVAPYTHSRIFWDTTTRHTVFASGGYARIIQLQDGRLMAVCESGGIQIAFSSNGGSSWSGQKRIVNNTNNTPNCVPDLVQLRDGTIVVGYNPRPSEPYTEDRRFGIRMKRSTDNGRTWSDEIFVNDASYTFHDGCWEPSFLELPSGELQLYFADEGPYTNNGDQQISLCRSFDGGQTWTKAQKISYRSGFRDGMPVPVLLKDESEIVVAIEDNGWGYGDFFPTTVRTTLDNNWQNYWVDATDKNRERALNLSYCPLATGGAPYLRVLPWGETVLSHQSPYENYGKIQMRVVVGNEHARDFRGVTTPFGQGPDNPQGLWNSLAVIDTGVVVAVSGINGKIEMIKGYPTRLLQAPFAHPTIDGRLTKGEGYFFEDGSQIKLGTQTGTRVIADYAFDMDSLYFVARVFDNTRATAGTPDAVTLFVDVDGSSSMQPQESSYQIVLPVTGSYEAYRGQSQRWTRIDDDAFAMRCAALAYPTSYVIEAAIAWTALGKSSAPVGQRMVTAVQVTDNRNGTVHTESIPDVKTTRTRTWMEFRLCALPDGIKTVQAERSQSTSLSQASPTCAYDLAGRLVSPSARGLVILCRPDGHKQKVIR